MLTLLTGEVQSGKTSALLHICKEAVSEGKIVFGVVCPGIFDEKGRKIGVKAKVFPEGEELFLANKIDFEARGSFAWEFDSKAVATVNDHFARMQMVPDLFVVDEIGPLELDEAKGFMSALKLLKQGPDVCGKDAVVVVRSSLVLRLREFLSKVWGEIQTVEA